MRIRLYEINQKYCQKELINEDEKITLQNLSDLSNENFKYVIEKWKNRFPLSYENFKIKYELKINTLEESFNRYDVTILKDKKYLKRDNYIRSQYKLLFPEMTEIIQYDIKKSIYYYCDNLLEKLPDSLKEKLKNLIFEKSEFDYSKEGNPISSGVIGTFLVSTEAINFIHYIP